MASGAVDLLITYRIVKLLVTPWEQQEAYKMGIIDKNGKTLKKAKDLSTAREKSAYTILHRFVFNLKRILQTVGLKSKLSSFAVALALLLKENKELEKHKLIIESSIISFLKQQKLYDDMIDDVKVINEQKEDVYMNCFGIDVFEKEGKLISEYEIL
jgi:hypothetical protein